MASEELERKLADLRSIFSLDRIINLKADKGYIQKYYLINKIPYSIFHSSSDLVHMGISRDGVLKPEDLLADAMFVDKYIKSMSVQNVLELATGRGANSDFLAKRNPAIQFYGLDLSPGQLNSAYARSRNLPNYFPVEGDYHDLSRYEKDFFDLVFILEALCYSTEKDKVLEEVHRVLKKDGVFIIFDGYRNKEVVDESEEIACRLTEKGMAVESGETYEKFKKMIEKNGFQIEYEEDVSEYVLPTMDKFADLTRNFLKRKTIAKILTRILPDPFVFNVAPGYLMPTMIRDGIATYRITVLRKT